MKKSILFFISIMAICSSLQAQTHRSVRPREIHDNMQGSIESQMEHLVGEIISVELPAVSNGNRAYSFTGSIKDTTWIKEVKNKKKAKLGRDYKLSNRPTLKEDIEGKKFKVLGTETETIGQYNLDTYLITTIQNIDNESEQYKWRVHIHSNHQGTSKPHVKIRLDKYSQIAREAYVDGKPYYLLNNKYAKPNKDNGYLNYMEVKCTDCDFYIGGDYLSEIYVSKYIDNDGHEFVFDEYRTSVNELPITQESYNQMVSSAISRLTNEGEYYFVLDKVEKPKSSMVRNGKTTVSSNESVMPQFQYVDNQISILWICLDKQISFTLKNLSSSTIKINWDNVCFIDENNEASGVLHKGIRYMDAGKPMASTLIPKGAELSDLIAPTNKLYYSGDWYQKSLIKHGNYLNKELLDKVVRVILPIEVNGVELEYSFHFKVCWEYSHPEYH